MILAPSLRPQGGQGPWISQFILLFTHRCFMPKLVAIGSAIPEKKLKILTHEFTQVIDLKKEISTDLVNFFCYFWKKKCFYSDHNFFLLFPNQAYAKDLLIWETFLRGWRTLKTLHVKERAMLTVLVQRFWYHRFDITVRHRNAYR